MGQERFDKAFRTYVERWAFKHPTPDDFFRTIENASGEDLGWFWRGWITNNWRLDQGINGVKYNKNDPKNGAVISIENFEKMAMPVTLEIEMISGKKEIVKLPVEVWQRNTSWSFSHDSTEEIAKITIDPENLLPDTNDANNVWKSEGFVAPKPGKYAAYVGDYSSQQIPVKVGISEDGDKMIMTGNGQEMEVEDKGNGTFVETSQGLEIKFNEDKKSFKLNVQGQSFDFTRD